MKEKMTDKQTEHEFILLKEVTIDETYLGWFVFTIGIGTLAFFAILFIVTFYI